MPYTTRMDPKGPIPVSLFFTCLADAFSPGVCSATVEVLERFGATVRVPLSQTCCGQPAFNSGNRKEARAMARKFLLSFPDDGPIVTPSGSCAAMVKHGYPVLFRDEPRMLARARMAKEAEVALTRPGIRVCRQLTAGISEREWIRGIVTGETAGQIEIRIEDAGRLSHTLNGVDLRNGVVIRDSMSAWTPCR